MSQVTILESLQKHYYTFASTTVKYWHCGDLTTGEGLELEYGALTQRKHQVN